MSLTWECQQLVRSGLLLHFPEEKEKGLCLFQQIFEVQTNREKRKPFDFCPEMSKLQDRQSNPNKKVSQILSNVKA
jgi:hypothetical protein